MEMDDSALQDLNFVPLQSAVLCADCEIITENRGGHCRVCGGRALLSMARVLGGPVGEERAVLLDDGTAEASRVVRDLVESAFPTEPDTAPENRPA